MSMFAPTLALPGPLPSGEVVLWRGRPDWRGLALRAFHVRKVAMYFGLLGLWRVASDLATGNIGSGTAISIVWLLVPCAAACGLLLLLAWLSSRSTQYTVTSRRVIMQFGIALPTTLNIPFTVISAAALRAYADGSGDIPIATTGNDRVAYLMLWPHVRPWRTARSEPMLRSVKDVERVSEIFARAVAAASNATGSVLTLVAQDANTNGAAVPAQAAAAA
jgi:PH (Pleckstrin Homology) domain-containing protein